MAQNCVTFDGTDDYGTTPTLLDTVPANGTVEFWFYIASTFDSTDTLNMMLWAKVNDETGGSLDYGAVFLWEANGVLRFETNINGAGFSCDTTKNSWAAGWYYIVHTWGALGMQTYVNGSPDGTDAETGKWANGATRDFIIGCTNYGGNLGFDFTGYIDEMRVSDKQRTAAEVTANWNGGVGKLLEVDGNTLALWHFNEGVDATAYDETANDHDLTMVGAGWTTGFPFPVVPVTDGDLIGIGIIRKS